MKAKARTRTRETNRKVKKKVSVLDQERVEYVDWKDVNLLRRFMSDRAKIRARRVTGNDAQQQRQVALAVKNAREMALLPYTSRVTTQRGRRRDDDGERRPRREEPKEFEELAEGAPEAAEDVEALDVEAAGEEVSS